MKFRIRSKLALALAIPLLALVAGGAFAAVEARAETDRLADQTDMARTALTNRDLVEALQAERSAVALALVDGDRSEETSVPDATAAVDAAVAGLASGTASGDVPLEPVLAAVAELDAVRSTGASAAGGQAMAEALAGRYDAVIDEALAWTSRVAVELDVAALRNGIEIIDAVQRRDEAEARVSLRRALAGAPDAAIGDDAVARVHQVRLDQLAVGEYQQDTDSPADVVVDRTVEVLATASGELADAARERMRWFVIAAAAAVCLAILVTYAATTSITRPLRLLRREAEEMASARLPRAVLSILETPEGEEIELPEIAPVRATSRDEVAEVAHALNDLQTRALGLAADQAMLRRNFSDSFVNLGRRNQLLLDRQLDFITELEEHETDPDQLDSLFKLDHLATRMRRNAESLLVLAGAASPRQWSAPVGISEVVRSGLGEVEHYQRVTIRHLDEARVVGTAAAGIAHVVAELVENALSFSPPEEPVEIKGRWAGEDYVVAIVDGGIGMGAEELDRANGRLSGHESYTVAPSRYLGHYVAGNLAGQLGIGVRLHSDPAGGIVATITLPPPVLVAVTEGRAAGPEPATDTEAGIDPPPEVGVEPDVAPAPPAASVEIEEPVPADRAQDGLDHDDLRSWLADALPRPRVERQEPDHEPVPAGPEPSGPEPVGGGDPADPNPGAEPSPPRADPTAPGRIDWMAVDSWDGDRSDRDHDQDQDQDWMRDLPPRVADRTGWAVGAVDGLRAAAEELRAPNGTPPTETSPTETSPIETASPGSLPTGTASATSTGTSGLPKRVPGAQRPGRQPVLDRSDPDRSDPDRSGRDADSGAPDPGWSSAGAVGFLEAFSPDGAAPSAAPSATESEEHR